MSTINLLPEGYLKQRTQRRVSSACLALSVLAIGSVIVAHWMTGRSKNRTLEVLDRVNAEYAEATKLIQRMQFLEAQKVAMLEKAETTASLVERVPRSTILAIIANARPRYTSLTEVGMATKQVEIQDIPSGRLSPSGNSVFSVESRADQGQQKVLMVEMTVTGLAATDAQVAKFIANLARSELIASVDLAYSQQKILGKIIAREFQVGLLLRNDIDAIDIVKKMRTKPKKANNPLLDRLRKWRSASS